MAKRRQSDRQAPTQVKRLSPVTEMEQMPTGFLIREGTSRRGLWRLRRRICRGRRAGHAGKRMDGGTGEAHRGLTAVSSGSKAGMPSDRHASMGGGSARSTEEAGQRPRREGAEQDSLFGESNTAAPEADKTVSTKLAGLVARARKEARLTNVVQYVDEELLRLAFRSLRKQAAPGVDGQSYEDYAANLDREPEGSARDD